MKSVPVEALLGPHVLDAVDYMRPSELDGYVELMEVQRAAAEAAG